MATNPLQPLIIVMLAALMAAPALGQSRSAAAPGAATRAELDSIAQAAWQAYPNAALTVTVLYGDSAFSGAYGSARPDGGGPAATPASVLRFGSVTKPFTAAAVLQLAGAGRLALDDPLAKFVAPAELPLALGVTLRHLLTHTSGIPTYTEPPVAREIDRPGVARLEHSDVLRALADEDLAFQPGSRFEYSNSNYYLLGLVIERVSGLSYGEYVARHLLRGGVSDTIAYCAPGDSTPLPGHGRQGERLVPSEPLLIDWPYAAGGLCGTAPALAAWGRALAEGLVVHDTLWREMIRTGATTSGERFAYGLGLRIDTVGGHRRAWHTGTMPGYTAMLSIYPDARLSIAVLSNSRRNPSVTQAEGDIARRLLGVERPRAEPLSADERAQYAGTYVMQTGDTPMNVRVTAGPESLILHFPGQPPLPIEHRGEGVFALKADPRYSFEFVERNGSVAGFVYRGTDGTFDAERVASP